MKMIGQDYALSRDTVLTRIGAYTYKRLSLVRRWFLFMNNTQLLVIRHLLGIKYPFPSSGDIGIGA